MRSPYCQISDYGLIGNARAAALVSKEGSIDWCCLPEFDTPAIFSALLEGEKKTFFSIAPEGTFRSRQTYLADTNVLETVFETPSGTAVLRDAFVAMKEKDKRRQLHPDHEILRIVTGLSGQIHFRMQFTPGLNYGQTIPKLADRNRLGIRFFFKENTFVLQSTLDYDQLTFTAKGVTAQFTLPAGTELVFSLSSCCQGPAIVPELHYTAAGRMEQTIVFWKEWIRKCTYTGMYEEAVRRSALALKLLTHAPSGSIVAAPTTSLPEEPGADKNWDYRYCWLRDASFTVRALLKLGFEEEAHAYLIWIQHATALTRPKVQIVYSVYGRRLLPEQALDWLAGYEQSRPVRIGNGADTQVQLDVYGEVMDAFYAYSESVSPPDKKTRKFLLGLSDTICKCWREPDNGIWEERGDKQHYTHSKVMAWVGLDRILKMARKFNWKKINFKTYEEVKERLAGWIASEGYNRELRCYTKVLNGTTVDASALLFPLVGYCKATAPEMQQTLSYLQAHLEREHLIYRYGDPDKNEEGSFGICNFWMAEVMSQSGDRERAKTYIDAILAKSGPTGLLAEEVWGPDRKLTGNYPQGFTHIGLIHAAMMLDTMLKKENNHAPD